MVVACLGIPARQSDRQHPARAHAAQTFVVNKKNKYYCGFEKSTDALFKLQSICDVFTIISTY